MDMIRTYTAKYIHETIAQEEYTHLPGICTEGQRDFWVFIT